VSGDTSTEIHLVRTEENVAEIDVAAERLGHRVGLGDVLADLNRRAARTRVPGLAVEWGFTWDRADQRSESRASPPRPTRVTTRSSTGVGC
jgi:hypothetical protein